MISIEAQFSIFLDNRPGTLARLSQALAKEGVNIVALAFLDSVDHVVVRMVVSDRPKAIKVFEQLKIAAQERQVLLMSVPNTPGAIAQIAQKLTEAGINIEYAYCTSPGAGQGGSMVLRTNDLEQTLDVLN